MAKPIKISILGDATSFERALGKVEKGLGGFAKSAGKYALIGGAALAGGALVGGKALFNLAEELTSLDQKAATVFGDSLSDVQAWSDEVAHRMGLTRTEAVGLASGMADLLKPMGFTADQAADMSTETLNLAGALSEWSNGQYSAAEVGDILAKAMLGERDSLKALGISLSQAEVDARALELAHADGRDAITDMDKALATQQLILEKSTDAQEAYAKGGNKLTAAQNKLRASVEEIKEKLARALMPVFVSVANFVSDKLIPTIEGIVEAFRQDGLDGVVRFFREKFGPNSVVTRIVTGLITSFQFLKEAITTTIDVATSVIRAFVSFFKGSGGAGGTSDEANKLMKVFEQLKDMVETIFEAIKTAIETVVKIVTELWKHFGDDIVETAHNLIGPLVGFFQGVLDQIEGMFKLFTSILKGDWSGAWEAIKQIVSGVWTQISSIVSGAWAIVRGAFEALTEEIKGVFSGAVDAIVGFFKHDLPNKLAGAAYAIWNAAAGMGRELKNGLVHGIGAAAGIAGDIASAVGRAIKNFINTQVIDRINGALEFTIPMPGPIPDVHVNPPNIPRLARGTDFFTGGMAVVGERGPEKVMLPYGSQVVPNHESGPAAGITVNVQTNADPHEIAREVAWAMRISAR